MKIKKEQVIKLMKMNWLVIATFLAVILGVCVGLGLQSANVWTDRNIMYLNFIGELFLRMLKCLILPLIVTSMITGIASLDLSLSSKIAWRAVLFYLTTTFLSVVLGIILVSTFTPGANYHNVKTAVGPKVKKVTTVDTMLDLVRNMFPPNIIQACIELQTTDLTPHENKTSETIYDYQITSSFVAGTNIIGIVVISTVVGIAMSISDVTHLFSVIDEFYKLIMKITAWVISLSPIGVFFLVVAQIVKMKDFSGAAASIGAYFGTVLTGCLLQGFVILPAMYIVSTRKNPYRFISGLSQALVTAFGTSSSSATLPVTLRCIVDNNGVDENVAKFMLPIGAVINMDGTALYEAVAAIFIAQLYDYHLSFGQIIGISITATAASIGAAGIPSAGLVTMVMVLDTIGLPATDISILLSVDWLLDRIRTCTNVLGDTFGAGIIDHLSRKDIAEFNNKTNVESGHNIDTKVDAERTFSNSSVRHFSKNRSTSSVKRNFFNNRSNKSISRNSSSNRSNASI